MWIFYLLLVVIVIAGTVYFWQNIKPSIATRRNLSLLGKEAPTLTQDGITFRDLNKNGRLAGWLFYIALAAALITAIAWTIAESFNIEVLNRVVTVLVIACPHALGLAIPLVVAITTALGARNGILVRNRLALEAAREIDVVIFDKTGTLTEGRFGVVDQVTADGWQADRALALAAALEADSEHLIAQAIRRFARDRKLVIPPIRNLLRLEGARGPGGIRRGDILHWRAAPPGDALTCS